MAYHEFVVADNAKTQAGMATLNKLGVLELTNRCAVAPDGQTYPLYMAQFELEWLVYGALRALGMENRDIEVCVLGSLEGTRESMSGENEPAIIL